MCDFCATTITTATNCPTNEQNTTKTNNRNNNNNTANIIRRDAQAEMSKCARVGNGFTLAQTVIRFERANDERFANIANIPMHTSLPQQQPPSHGHHPQNARPMLRMRCAHPLRVTSALYRCPLLLLFSLTDSQYSHVHTAPARMCV